MRVEETMGGNACSQRQNIERSAQTERGINARVVRPEHRDTPSWGFITPIEARPTPHLAVPYAAPMSEPHMDVGTNVRYNDVDVT